jgi:hypothetical protein
MMNFKGLPASLSLAAQWRCWPKPLPPREGCLKCAAGWLSQEWQQQKSRVRVSALQWSILSAVQDAGLPVQMEYNEGLFSIDMAVFLPGKHGRPPLKVCTCSACRPNPANILRFPLLRCRQIGPVMPSAQQQSCMTSFADGAGQGFAFRSGSTTDCSCQSSGPCVGVPLIALFQYCVTVGMGDDSIPQIVDGCALQLAIEADGTEHYSCNRALVDGVFQFRWGDMLQAYLTKCP